MCEPSFLRCVQIPSLRGSMVSVSKTFSSRGTSSAGRMSVTFIARNSSRLQP